MAYKPAADRYEQIPYNRCGHSGLLLPAISLGLWHNFGGIDDYTNAQEIIHYAFDHGITHFDLANNYGPPPGSAEETFGKILKEDLQGYRDELIISTKAGYRMWEGPYGEWGSRKYVLASLDQSLKRMGLEYVDIFYSHRPDENTPLEETMGALAHAVQQGKALYVGLSNYSAKQTAEAVQILHDMGVRCLIHQPKYSMFERWTEEQELNKVLKNSGMGAIPFSPLAQGLLTNKYLKGIPKDSRAAKESGFLQQEHISEAVVQKVQRLNAIAQKRGQSLAQMALAWIMRDDWVTTVLVGVSRVGQLKDNMAFLKHKDFSSEELEQIESILKS